eukprot:gene16810-34996_t
MLLSDGCSRFRFQGLVFDGQHTADIGIEHDAHAPGLFETRIRHQNNKLINFGTAGIRIGNIPHTSTNGKLETSEVLFENCIFAHNGGGTSGTVGGGILILNFNDYDNTFDGCTFVNNSAGNSVRRCVSVGSASFVVSPHHTGANPTTIEGCVVAGWTEKTEPPPPQQQSVVANTPWPQMNQVVLFAGNLLNGNTASSTSLLASRLKNMVVEDLKTGVDVDNAGTGKVDRVHLQQFKLTPATTFLKRWWPGMPTVLVDARDYGCNVTSTSYTSMDTTDEGMATRIATSSTACVQATINAAAKKGGGAAAYFAPGQYAINSTIVVPPGNYTVLGSGYQTQFQWALRAANTTADQAVFKVQGGGRGLQLMHFQVVGTGSGIKILHEGQLEHLCTN